MHYYRCDASSSEIKTWREVQEWQRHIEKMYRSFLIEFFDYGQMMMTMMIFPTCAIKMFMKLMLHVSINCLI